MALPERRHEVARRAGLSGGRLIGGTAEVHSEPMSTDRVERVGRATFGVGDAALKGARKHPVERQASSRTRTSLIGERDVGVVRGGRCGPSRIAPSAGVDRSDHLIHGRRLVRRAEA